MDVLIVLGTTAAWGYGIALIGVGYDYTTMGGDHRMLMENEESSYRMQV
jgi:hypothetical protein